MYQVLRHGAIPACAVGWSFGTKLFYFREIQDASGCSCDDADELTLLCCCGARSPRHVR